MEKIHLERLQTLHDFVRDNVKGEHFNMEHFRAREAYVDEGVVEFTPVPFRGEDACGTVGCLLGWAPFAFPKDNLKDRFDIGFRGDSVLDFNEMAEEFLGVDIATSDWKNLFGVAASRSNRKSNSKTDVLENLQHFINEKVKLLGEGSK